MAETKVPAIPAVQSKQPVDLAAFINAVRQVINVREGLIGDPLDANVTFRDLIAAGIAVQSNPNGTPTTLRTTPIPAYAVPIGAPPPRGLALDYTIPPQPKGVAANGSLTNIFVTWSIPDSSNIAYTEVWASLTNDLSAAFLAGVSLQTIYSHVVSPSSTYYYWVRHVSYVQVPGPYNAFSTSGVLGSTSSDPTYLLSALHSPLLYAQSAFVIVPTTVTVNGVSVPPGAYLSGAYIQNGSLVSSMLANLSVTSGKLSDVQSDNFVTATSGWQLKKDGTNEFAQGIFHVQLATAWGTLGAVSIASGGHVAGGKASYTDATAGFFLGETSGYKASFGTATEYLNWDGTHINIVTPGFSVLAGVVTILGGQTAYNTGAGFWFGYTGGAYQASLGSPGGDRLTFDGTSVFAVGNIYRKYVPGYALLVGSDAVDATNGGTTSYVKCKEIGMASFGELNVSFAIANIGGVGSAQGLIYVNGLAVGTPRTTTNPAYDWFAENIAGLNPNDLVQLYIKQTGGGFCHAQQFRLYAGQYHAETVTM